ncbi:MAG: ABC transporter ATP-binding protein [Pyrinomonadaceae bacterium MAG19_C2-C3]|nr:ABC transporter ATP-binding protein [Pyrinomonadaceae bacterium MAG19_C2-C3]
MSEIAIRAVGLSKLYHIGRKQERYRTLQESLVSSVKTPARWLRGLANGAARERRNSEDTIWALKDISFEIKRGEVLGIIGANGAGKSTLLKVLARITEPSKGYADINGRVGSLLEVGTGFHPELTGRENISLSGSILGMRRREIERHFDSIVGFAEVEKFIDTAVKHYSSGMYLRLAFAVAAHLDPEILVVDEVLAVGDAMFQMKCIGKMQEVGESGRTVLFVSHDMTAIQRLTETSLLLRGGEIDFWGSTSEAITRYTSPLTGKKDDLATRRTRKGDGVVRINSIDFYDEQGLPIEAVGSGESVTVVIGYSADLKSLHPGDIALDMRFKDALGHPIVTFSTRFSAPKETSAPSKNGVMVCRIPNLALAEEIYNIDLWLAYRGGLSDHLLGAGALRVVTANFYETGQSPVKRKHGATLMQHEWSFGGGFDGASLVKADEDLLLEMTASRF